MINRKKGPFLVFACSPYPKSQVPSFLSFSSLLLYTVRSHSSLFIISFSLVFPYLLAPPEGELAGLRDRLYKQQTATTQKCWETVLAGSQDPPRHVCCESVRLHALALALSLSLSLPVSLPLSVTLSFPFVLPRASSILILNGKGKNKGR